MRRRINRVKGILAGKGGFTLLELIVVIAIVGFLAAMVAPRFAGIVDSAIDPTCDTNQQRLVNAIGAFTERELTLPDELVELATGPKGGVIPHEGQPGGRLAESLVVRNRLSNHVLNADEAAQLKEMGITKVRDIDGTFVDVASGLMVAMVGAGAPNAGATIPAVPAGYEIGEYDHIARIVFGVAPDSELVDKGYVTAAGLCPGGLQKEGIFNHYLLVVPRLEATVARLADTTLDKAIGLDEDKATTGHEVTNYTLEAQELWMFATQCPEGHKWPADVNEYWRIVTP